MRYLWIIGTFLLGCARGSYSPVGPNLFAVSCTGNQRACYKAAGEACPFGFSVLDASSQTGQHVLATGQSSGTSYGNQYSANRTYQATSSVQATTIHSYAGDMLVRCNGPQIQYAEQ